MFKAPRISPSVLAVFPLIQFLVYEISCPNSANLTLCIHKPNTVTDRHAHYPSTVRVKDNCRSSVEFEHILDCSLGAILDVLTCMYVYGMLLNDRIPVRWRPGISISTI